MMNHDVHSYRTLIERALEYDHAGAHTFADVAKMITDDDAQLWCGPGSIMVTMIVEYPQKKTLHLFLGAGHLSEIESMLPEIETWAKAQGCVSATLLGRPGWERTFFARRGWKRTAILMEVSYNG